ncbi:MAG: RluA family pseudouridine synthase [Planctomycetales bacterium]
MSAPTAKLPRHPNPCQGGPSIILPALEILCDDGPLLAVNKPAGLLTLGAGPEIPTLERQVKAYLKERFGKPGNVYLGIPHRLDRPVSGVMVFARNSKAAARLAEQFRDRQVRKVYWGLVERPPAPSEGELVDWLLKDPNKADVSVVPATTAGAREARLRYRILPRSGGAKALDVLGGASVDDQSFARPDSGVAPIIAATASACLLEIELLTGRMHQIRVQLASRGWPIVGDRQYGAAPPLEAVDGGELREAPIALHARQLTLRHPIRYDELTITAPLPALWSQRFGISEC